MSDSARAFGGSIAQLYDTFMVPLMFEPYAADLAARVAARPVASVLETAAGTGVVTRHLARALPADVEIVATDLNPPMLDRAAAAGTARPVIWRQADALALPFDDQRFDVVVCQFGAMFFPDKGLGFAEARRVLRPGGAFLFSVWDRVEASPLVDVTCRTVAALFPDDPPRFMESVPHGYHDVLRIGDDLRRAGFDTFRADTVTFQSHAPGPESVAIALCQSTPFRAEIEARGPGMLEAATAAVTRALTDRYGAGPIEGPIQAKVFTVDR